MPTKKELKAKEIKDAISDIEDSLRSDPFQEALDKINSSSNAPKKGTKKGSKTDKQGESVPKTSKSNTTKSGKGTGNAQSTVESGPFSVMADEYKKRQEAENAARAAGKTQSIDGPPITPHNINESPAYRQTYAHTDGIHADEFSDTVLNAVLRDNLIYNRAEIEWYEKFARFGVIDPYNSLTQTKEYLFFTKPDCHIVEPNTFTLNPVLANMPFFTELRDRYPYIILQLQRSAVSSDRDGFRISKNPFMAILSNGVKSSLSLPAITAETMDGSTNMYGTTMSYRKDGYKSDENIEFSLEFEDTRYLEIYMLAKAYEEYERLKDLGIIYPPNIDGVAETSDGHCFSKYIKNKELHDVFGVYRFIVAEDYEELIYWSYICGAYFANVPRDAFNDLKNGEGLTFSLDFKGFYVEDMLPETLYAFNNLIDQSYFSGGKPDSTCTHLPILGTSGSTLAKDMEASINGRWASFPYIERVSNDIDAWQGAQGMKYKYRLEWFTKQFS